MNLRLNVLAHAQEPGLLLPNQVHAFGAILAEGQTLHHEFRIRNPLDRPLRLLAGTAVTPCCSSIGPLPDSIPARGEARIPTVFNPRFQSGFKEVLFLIETDAEIQRRSQLALQADMVSTWEVSSPEGSVITTLPSGRSRRLAFRIVGRRKGDRGRDLPESVSASPPIEAAFSGQASSTATPDGVVESARDVVVTLPAMGQPGSKRGDLVFSWVDGREETVPLGWEVRPRLNLTPAGLVLRRSNRPVERTVLVQSDGPPFKLLKVVSPLLASPVDLPQKPDTQHTIKIGLNLSEGSTARTQDVQILTDSVEQPSMVLSILIMPDVNGEGE